jgi:hypothetical protein
MKTLAQLNTYSGTTVFYTDQSAGGGQVLANRYQINGLLDTAQPVFQNIEKLCSAAGSWLSYDIHEGKWGVVINQSGTSIVSFNDSNIIGSISVSGTGLQDLYNQTKVQFPHRELKDSADFVTIEIPSGDRNSNEENNILNITYDIINDPVQAQLLGTIELKQSRVDLVINFQTDFSYINLKAGDVIDVTEDRFGFTNSLFRIITITEVQDDNGALLMQITALQYDANVYSTSDLYKYTRTDANGIITIGSIGTPGTPQVTKYEIDSRPRVIVSSTAPTGIVEGMEFWLSNDVGLADANRSYKLIATTKPTNGNVYTSGQTVQFDYDNLDTSNFVVKTRAFNTTVVGPFSSASGLITFTATQVTSAIGPNTKTVDALGNVLTALAAWELLKGIDGLYAKVFNTGSFYEALGQTIKQATGVDLFGNAASGVTALTIKDEGTILTTATGSLNFVGEGVTATYSSGATTITIPGGGSGSGYTGSLGYSGSIGYTGSAGSGGSSVSWNSVSTNASYNRQSKTYFNIYARLPPDRSDTQDPTTGVSSDLAPTTGTYSIGFSNPTPSGFGSDIIPLLGNYSLVSGKQIYLYKSDGTLVETVDASQCTIYSYEWGNYWAEAPGLITQEPKIKIPFAPREYGTDYYILMDEGVIQYCNYIFSPAITSPTVWNFNTPSYDVAQYTNFASSSMTSSAAKAISAVSYFPLSGSFLCSTSTFDIIINYSLPMIDVTSASLGIYATGFPSTLVASVTAPVTQTSPTQLLIKKQAIPTLDSGKTYFFRINPNGRSYLQSVDCGYGYSSSPTTQVGNYTIGSTGAVTLSSYTVKTASNIYDAAEQKIETQTNIDLLFNKPVMLGSGNIIIYKGDNSIHQTINVSQTFNTNKSSGILYISTGSLTVTINPTKDFLTTSTYYVKADSGVFVDSCGNAWVGISNTSTIRFTTDAGPKTTSQSVASGIHNLAYDRLINVSTGTLVVKRNSDNTVMATIPGNSASISTATYVPGSGQPDYTIVAVNYNNFGYSGWDSGAYTTTLNTDFVRQGIKPNWSNVIESFVWSK